jgi:hypothetical protein
MPDLDVELGRMVPPCSSTKRLTESAASAHVTSVDDDVCSAGLGRERISSA